MNGTLVPFLLVFAVIAVGASMDSVRLRRRARRARRKFDGQDRKRVGL